MRKHKWAFGCGRDILDGELSALFIADKSVGAGCGRGRIWTHCQHSQQRSLPGILQADHGNVHFGGPVQRLSISIPLHDSKLAALGVRQQGNSPEQPQQPVVHPFEYARHDDTTSPGRRVIRKCVLSKVVDGLPVLRKAVVGSA